MGPCLRASLAVVLLSGVAACILQRGQKDPAVGSPNDFVGAGVYAATGLGAAAVNRKVTGDCYAACTTGYVCNHDTGMCEQRTCMCPADRVCEIVGGEVVCTQPRRAKEGAIDASADADADGG
jgi:hypothetical protein